MHDRHTLNLDLPDPTPTDDQLRAAHRHLGIKRSFDECMRIPWMPALLRCCARDMARRAARKTK